MARGRKKKIIETEELDLNENKIYAAPVNNDDEINEGFQSVILEDHFSNNINNEFTDWDVKLEDKIEFFDANLSYELTGYRPINEEQGLDFNPDWFTEAKRVKEETGVYCAYPKGSKKYTDFWKEQYRRCNEGFTSHGYRITGDNYFFLNFYRLKDISSAKRAGSGRTTGFPSFYAKQYEYFHYIELCSKTGHDVCALKARGVK